MSYDPKKVISVAEAEVGYLEKKTNSDLDDQTANAGSANYTKYARDLDNITGFYNGRKQSVAWCDVFVDWCFVTAYGVDAALKLLCQPKKSCGAGCRFSRDYYKSKGRLFDSPQAGDQIFFWPKTRTDPNVVQHTGLVRAVDKTYVYTVEGNTSSVSGVVANGGGVAEKKYKLTNARIAGYGRPDYGVEYVPDDIEPETPVSVYALGERSLSYQSPYMEGADVSALQTALNSLGFACGTVDGIFGKKTKAGVLAFQASAGLETDGIFGAKSFAALTALQGQTTPPATETPEAEPPIVTEPPLAEETETYIVQPKDTLWGIAKNHLGRGARYTEIMTLNNMQSTVIRGGMVLKIPKA